MPRRTVSGTTRRLAIGLVVLAALLPVLTGGCGAYFNTFFNAKKAFNAAEKARKSQKRNTRAGTGQYSRAIEKALKVIEQHPNSKYYDDALYVLGVSYYYTGQYGQSERRLRELLIDYPDSKYVRKAQLYLAQAKLQLGDVDEAMKHFENIFSGDYDRSYKAEAALSLGTYHYEQNDFKTAKPYLMAVRDSLGDADERKDAQTMIADGQFEEFRFKDALGSYLQLLGMEPTSSEEYHALFRATECSYRLLRVKDGFDYLQRLMDNQLYYDSLGVLKMKQAEGYELDDDLAQAEAIYTEVTDNSENPRLRAEAYYRLGLIYQFDYDRLEEAKEFYDKSVEANRRSDFADDALQRSSDIGKLKTFAHTTLDTSATAEQIDDAADTQYELAELYWFKLNKPDTAILEMQYLVDSFPDAYVAPHALIALAQMKRDHEADTAAADSLLHQVLVKYPHSDYVAQAMEALGLAGTAADTGYAYYHIRRAEDFLLDQDNVDSARWHYQMVVDSFPESEYYLQARFNLVWLTQQYDNPEDSSVVFAYQAIVDSFPGTPEAQQARQLLGQSSFARPAEQAPVDTSGPGGERLAAEEQTGGTQVATTQDTTTYIDPLVALYRGPDGDTLTKLDAQPIEVDRPFEFPVEAAGLANDQFYLYFQILLDFSGRVVDYKLKVPSGNEELDRRAKEAVETMTFDPLKMSRLISQYDLQTDKTGLGYWFVYEFPVEKPEHLR